MPKMSSFSDEMCDKMSDRKFEDLTDNQKNGSVDYNRNFTESSPTLKTELKTEVGAGDIAPNVDQIKPELRCCIQCGKTYSKGQYVRDHIRTVHLNSKANYSCRVCGLTFSWRVTALKHTKRYHPEKNSSEMIDVLY